MAGFDPLVPEYRYFVADLLSNSVLDEISFSGVSYERSLKSAGSFSGSIPVIDKTAAFNLYDSTMPGRTALYVVRNNQCVWGGIIWSRSYSASSKMLNVNASEFTSYLYHRNIWKTFSNDFGATAVKASGGNVVFTLQSGSFDFVPGAPVKVEFYEISNFQYDGYYTILSAGLTTTSFRVSIPSLPNGTYENVTIKIRVDTYDYVRQLLDEMSIDFSGIEFPNNEIEPALSTSHSISNKVLNSNFATLTVPAGHGIIAGQSVEVLNVDATFNGTHTITSTTATTITYPVTAGNVASTPVSPVVRSVTNKAMTDELITLTTTGSHGFSAGQYVEIAGVDASSAPYEIFNGTHVINTVPTPTTFTYYIYTNEENVASTAVSPTGTATFTPRVVSGSYGPFPGNSDIGLVYSTMSYSSVEKPNATYRGYEVRSIGEELDEYSDFPDGFEYRIDCDYDTGTSSFTRTFTLLPLQVPNPPAAGEVSPLSRFGADELVFEYPGNIYDVSIDESAENSATRFFVIGNIGDLGEDASQPYAVATSTELLDLGWPLLDMQEAKNDISDELDLYENAERYLSEFRPPVSDIKVRVNGSVAPVVGSYAPGDWCALIVNDPFIQLRLASDLEVRDDILVRKIENIKVSVPDGVPFPEEVELLLIPEWEIDRVGE